MERKSRLPMFGSSRHKTGGVRNEQRRKVQSAPTEATPRDDPHRPSDVITARTSDGAHIIPPLSPSVHYDVVPTDRRCMKFSPGAYYHESSSQATSGLLQGTSSGCGDAPIGEVSVPGIASMPTPQSQVTISKQIPTKRGRLGLAVDAVRGVLGVANASEVKQTERGHGIVFPSNRNPSSKGIPQSKRPTSRRDTSNLASAQQSKELYIEFVTPPSVSPPTCSSPPPLPSPCDILSLPQSAKRPMKMPLSMSTFKSNNEPDVRSTGGESRLNFDSSFMWTKNPVAAIYYDDQVPVSPPQSPVYMLYDTSPEHMYDSIPDDSSVDGMQEYCASPTLPKRQMCLSPTNYPTNLRTGSRPSCGIRMAEMRAAKRLQSPPLEIDVPGGDDAVIPHNLSPILSPHAVQQHHVLPEPGQLHEHKQMVSPRDHKHVHASLHSAQSEHVPERAHVVKPEKKHLPVYSNVPSKMRNVRKSQSPRNSVHTEHASQQSLVPGNQSKKAAEHRHKREPTFKANRPQTISQSNDTAVSSTKHTKKPRTKCEHVPTKKSSAATSTNLVQHKMLAEVKCESAKGENKPAQQRKLRQPSKPFPSSSSQSKNGKNIKSKHLPGNKVKNEYVKPTDRVERVKNRQSDELYAPLCAEAKPSEGFSNFPKTTTGDINVTENIASVEVTMESSASMKDSLMSISCSSCSPQSSDSEHSGSCTSSLNSSMVMDSSIESSDIERSYMQSAGNMLTNIASLDMFDITDSQTDIVTPVSYQSGISKLKQPSPNITQKDVRPSQLKKPSSSKVTERSSAKVKPMSINSTSKLCSQSASPQKTPRQPYKYGIPSSSGSYAKSRDTSTNSAIKSATYNVSNSKSNRYKKSVSVPEDKKPAAKFIRTLSFQENITTPKGGKSEGGIRSPSRAKPVVSKGNSEGKPRVSKLVMPSTKTTKLAERYNGQRLSLQPPKPVPTTDVKPRRHYSDSTDHYKRNNSTLDNTSSTSTTPSSVSGSPLSSESCASPLSPFHSDSSSSGGGGGGLGGSKCVSRQQSGSPKKHSTESKSESSNHSKYSGSKQKEGSKRAITCPTNTANFSSKMNAVALETSTSQKHHSGLKQPSVTAKILTKQTKCEPLLNCDKRDNVSYLTKPSKTKSTASYSESSNFDIPVSGSLVCLSESHDVSQPVLINVHNDYAGKDSDQSTSALNLCGAGTHIPSDNTERHAATTESVLGEVDRVCNQLAGLTTGDDHSVADSLSVAEIGPSIEDDPIMDLTEDSTYKIIDNKSSDDCEDIQDDDSYLNFDENENNNAIIVEHSLNCAELANPLTKRHAVYDPLVMADDPFQQIFEEAEKVVNLIKDAQLTENNIQEDTTLDLSLENAEFLMGGNVESYEQLCESSLEAMSSSPAKSIDLSGDMTSSNNTTTTESLAPRENSGSVSDSGEIFRLRSVSSPALQKRAIKRMGQYTNTFMEDQCSLKRVEATSSLNVSENTSMVRRDCQNVVSQMVMDTAISESSLHTCVIDSADQDSQEKDQLDQLTNSLILAYPNLRECQLLSSTLDEGESSDAESFVCNFNMNSSSNNLALGHDMTLSTNSLSEQSQLYPSDSERDRSTLECGEHQSSSEPLQVTIISSIPRANNSHIASSSELSPDLQHIKNRFKMSPSLSRKVEDDTDTDTLKQSESCLTLCESRSESESSGFTSLKDDCEDRVSTSSSNMSMCSSTSSQQSTTRSAPKSRLRPPRVGLGRGLKPPTPTRRFTTPRSPDSSSMKERVNKRMTLAPVDEGGMAMAVPKGDEGYYTMSIQGQVEKVSQKCDNIIRLATVSYCTVAPLHIERQFHLDIYLLSNVLLYFESSIAYNVIVFVIQENVFYKHNLQFRKRTTCRIITSSFSYNIVIQTP